MPYRKEELANGEVYHVVLRGLDDNLIFKDINDYYRGVFSIYEFNNENSIEIRKRREERKKEKASGDPFSAIDKRDKLVEVLCFCFMPNHIHLLLRQLKNGGITKFMRKVGAGYGGYFNKKNSRKGYVFQNRFRSVYIESDGQLKTVFTYIHTNPISLIEPGWKGRGINNPKEAIKFLEEYKWSSYQDYIGKKNFPSVTDRDFMTEAMGGTEGCAVEIKNWVEYKKKTDKFQDILLE